MFRARFLVPLALVCSTSIAWAEPEATAAVAAEAAPATAVSKPVITVEPDPVLMEAAKAEASQTDAAPRDTASDTKVAAAEEKPAAPAPPSVNVSIDLGSQRMTVTENGEAKYSWAISSGTSEFPTPRGTFRPQWTAKMWYSKKYDNAPMPHAVFIHGGVAIHATYHTGALGRPASHGCIRLAPGNAKTFYNMVQRHGMSRVRVAVHGYPKFRSQNVASRKKKVKQQYAAYSNSFSSSGYGWGYADTPPPPRRVVQKRRPSNAYYGGSYGGSYGTSGGYSKPPKYIYRNGQKFVYVQRKPSYYYGY